MLNILCVERGVGRMVDLRDFGVGSKITVIEDEEKIEEEKLEQLGETDSGVPTGASHIESQEEVTENGKEERYISQSDEKDKRLAELNLKYGSAHVYRVNGKFLGTGDYNHCPKEDIDHNLKVLKEMIIKNPNLKSIGKDYDCGVYENKDLDWKREVKTITQIYKDNIIDLTDQKSLSGEKDISTIVTIEGTFKFEVEQIGYSYINSNEKDEAIKDAVKELRSIETGLPTTLKLSFSDFKSRKGEVMITQKDVSEIEKKTESNEVK